MTKTIQTQIEKSRNLITGLHKHLHEGGSGVSTQDLDAMERSLDILAAVSDECDRLRTELAPKVKRMNELLQGVKDSYLSHKLIIKNKYPQERWADYGLPDKR
ncbi:MAG: hypothetical protein IJJ94_05010 [Bacteroidaceae bacterium]|nr:hypothetical protein [Bacteroidaceae bacterium]